jgi:nicotinate-nucleotide adenylyltransferase
MRIAFFGGTFDPPHRGHLAIAQAAAERFSLDTIFFAPTGRQPLKPDGHGASFTDRLAMVELLCTANGDNANRPRFVPSTLDAPRDDGQPNYTVDTLHRLRAELAGSNSKLELFSIVGADAAWIVVSRPGFSLADLASLALTPAQQAQVHLLEGVYHPASSTEIRERMESGLDCSTFLTPEVLQYIAEHRLYLSHKAAENE